MTLRQHLTAAKARLVGAGLEPPEAARDVLYLAMHVLGWDRVTVHARDLDPPPDGFAVAYDAAIERRTQREPVAYITGQKEFFGLTLQVDHRVLDPRADTETLVEWALSCLADTSSPEVVDLGTGSGAIALAIKHTRPDAQVSAVDASADALAVASANAERLALPVNFHHGSWLAPLNGHAFDAIVSNPPYVASDDEHLAALKHEPLSALASGADGLDDIRVIVREATQHLKPNGWLLIEHGYDQAHAVQTLLGNQGFVNVQSRPDLAGILRCSGGQWPTVK